MIKAVRIVFLWILALSLVAAMAVFIFFQVFDPDQYFAPLLKKASSSLGRPVSIGTMGLGLSLQGITLDAGPLVIADDPDFTSQPFVKVDKVRVSFDWKKLIFEHRMDVTRILVVSPRVHFIRNQNGNFNVRGFSSSPAVSPSVMTKNAPVPSLGVIARSAKGATKQSFNNAFTIRSIQIQDGAISYIDQNQNMPFDLWLSGINATVTSLALTEPFEWVSDADVHILDSASFKNIRGRAQLHITHFDISSPETIAATGGIDINGGTIADFNIIEIVISHAMSNFGIGQNLSGLLKGPLGAPDTLIENAQTHFSLHEGTLVIDNALVHTNLVEATAKGTIDQGLNTDMQTTLHLNSDVTDSLVGQMPGLKMLCDDSNRIAINASLSGRLPHLKYKPDKDFRKKSRRALMQEGANILGALLGGR
jgi:hypothetical protein